MTKETKHSETRLTIHLEPDQLKAIRLLAIIKDQSLREFVSQALEEYLNSHFGEGIVVGLKEAKSLTEVESIFDEIQKNEGVPEDEGLFKPLEETSEVIPSVEIKSALEKGR